ncbi:hypothetical protein EVAR_22730_1 [Eumeta japonica]|uniref:Uncharacterized protein n=1 Tax=Eumeta variegata TaxID=151549 RepID=A0A4C1USD0_EUMVA|nr:hypothetical protein EVAR_22730_1 [Eumeta japonica]
MVCNCLVPRRGKYLEETYVQTYARGAAGSVGINHRTARRDRSGPIIVFAGCKQRPAADKCSAAARPRAIGRPSEGPTKSAP